MEGPTCRGAPECRRDLIGFDMCYIASLVNSCYSQETCIRHDWHANPDLYPPVAQTCVHSGIFNGLSIHITVRVSSPACLLTQHFFFVRRGEGCVPATVRTISSRRAPGAVLTRTNSRCLALSCCIQGGSLSASSRLSLLFRPCSGNKAPGSRSEDE